VSDGLEHKSWVPFAQGDSQIWREFISLQIPRLYRIFMNRWPNPSMSEELVQKTIFDAVRGLESYDISKGSPEEWLHGIARNNIRLEIRKRASRPAPNGDISSYFEALIPNLTDEIIERQEKRTLFVLHW
jgi:DNA-directed RNA polymerase specialized sigma24 family protein